jgi:hypothetical protein
MPGPEAGDVILVVVVAVGQQEEVRLPVIYRLFHKVDELSQRQRIQPLQFLPPRVSHLVAVIEQAGRRFYFRHALLERRRTFQAKMFGRIHRQEQDVDGNIGSTAFGYQPASTKDFVVTVR